MTIRKGEEWGSPVDRPAGLVVVASDAELAAHSGDPVAPGGGDLHRTLGSPDTARSPMQRVEVDGLRVVLDGGSEHAAIAHVVIRRSWWRGEVVAVMNVSHRGAWMVAPRAHPNDGWFDVVEVSASMSSRQRWAARGRLAAGSHVPHPCLTTGRATAREWSFTRPMRVWVDGVDVGRARRVSVQIVPDRHVIHF